MWRFWLALAALTGLIVVAATAPPKRKPRIGSPEYWDGIFNELVRDLDQTLEGVWEDEDDDVSIRIEFRV